ncbi:MAG: cyanophycin synthetase, partial [Planctomycetota bacterium]
AHEAGVRFYDDSKSSTPDATRTALRALGETSRLDRVHLICGGYDKGLDLQPLARCALELATTHAIGATGPRIAEHAATLGADRCQRHATLDEAFEAIVHQVRRDEVVLLSPGCASWDQFPDFRARGERFTQLAERWTRNHALTESQP